MKIILIRKQHLSPYGDRDEEGTEDSRQVFFRYASTIVFNGMRVAVEAIRAISCPVQSRREKAQVATISAHNDTAIGEMVADATERVGAEGAISVEEAKTTETALEVVEGMQFDRGYISPYFITNAEKMEAVLEEPLILLYEKRITRMDDLLPLLEQIAKSAQSLLIVAEDAEGEALATLVVNKIHGTLACIAVKASGFGDRRKAMLQDIAILTGGQLVAEELGLKLEKLSLADLGRAKRVVVDKDNTTIIGGAGVKQAIDGRCAEIRKQIELATSDYDKEKLQERLAKLAGGKAVLSREPGPLPRPTRLRGRFLKASACNGFRSRQLSSSI